MEKWILLKDFLSDEARYAKLTQLFVDYKPDSKTITFPKEETGCKEDQTATTESDIGWHVIKGEDDTCYLISAELTKFKLSLYGKNGFYSGTSIIKEYTESLYGCNDIKAEGVSITEEFFEKLPKHIKNLEGMYWIPKENYDSDDEDYNFYVYYEIKIISDGCVRSRMLYSAEKEYLHIFSLRPCVRLPINTLVNIGDAYYNGKTPKKALKIKI